ncbi:MAG: M48 family metallopeptidase [Candidatus Roizmanbacteria bacterium]|nr:M48 family metallopeptidase [Candidatus Roizmanbacteria bacterium]
MLLLFSVTYWLYIYGIPWIIILYNIRKRDIVFTKVAGLSERIRRTQKRIETLKYTFSIPSGIFAMGFAIPFSKTVYISEKMMNALSYKELQYVMYHEIGHYKHNHPNKQIYWFTGLLLIYANIQPFLPFHIVFPILFALIFGNIGRYIARRHEDEADIYAMKQIGFENVKIGILALKKLYKEDFYRYGLLEGYFRVHRTNSERIVYLKGSL